MEEVWKTIPGFEGEYEASDHGRVRSLDRVIVESTGRRRKLTGRVLRPASRPSGHLCIVLGRKGGTWDVHVVVALTFIGPKPSRNEVLHRDHNPQNNHISNLRYGTRSENLLHDYESGSQRKQFAVVATEPDGNSRNFRSVTHAAQHYGLTQPAVTHAIQQGYASRKLKVRFAKCSTI